MTLRTRIRSEGALRSHQWAFAYGRVPTEAALIHLAAQLLDDLAKVCHVFLNDPSRVA
jgi:hypothetical protein